MIDDRKDILATLFHLTGACNSSTGEWRGGE